MVSKTIITYTGLAVGGFLAGAIVDKLVLNPRIVLSNPNPSPGDDVIANISGFLPGETIYVSVPTAVGMNTLEPQTASLLGTVSVSFKAELFANPTPVVAWCARGVAAVQLLSISSALTAPCTPVDSGGQCAMSKGKEAPNSTEEDWSPSYVITH